MTDSFNDNECLLIWQELTADIGGISMETLLPLFALEILNRWGKPLDIRYTKTSPFPRNELFLGYYADAGWNCDYWAQSREKLADDEFPIVWISLKNLPNLDSFRQDLFEGKEE